LSEKILAKADDLTQGQQARRIKKVLLEEVPILSEKDKTV
jgi:hypothetical protein